MFTSFASALGVEEDVSGLAAGAVLFFRTGPCAITDPVSDPTKLSETTNAAAQDTSAGLLRKFAKIAIDDIDEHTAEQLLRAEFRFDPKDAAAESGVC
jgi:hypothetical protein